MQKIFQYTSTEIRVLCNLAREIIVPRLFSTPITHMLFVFFFFFFFSILLSVFPLYYSPEIFNKIKTFANKLYGLDNETIKKILEYFIQNYMYCFFFPLCIHTNGAFAVWVQIREHWSCSVLSTNESSSYQTFTFRSPNDFHLWIHRHVFF